MIRKAVLLVTGTVAGVVGVVGYNPPQLDSSIASSGMAPESTDTPVPVSSASASSSNTASPKASTTKSSTTSPVKPQSKTNTESKSQSSTSTTESTTRESQAPAAEPATPAKKSGVYQGDTSYTRWGPVQVEVTITNGQITDVSTLQYPNGDRKSLSISNRVIPWLQQETLNVQSANISGISGATYTVTGFKASLASALQKAGF